MFAMGSNGEGSHDESCPVILTIQLMHQNESKVPIQTNLDQTVKDFKEKVTNLTRIPSKEQHLLYMGRILKDPHTLRSYGLFLLFFKT